MHMYIFIVERITVMYPAPVKVTDGALTALDKHELNVLQFPAALT